MSLRAFIPVLMIGTMPLSACSSIFNSPLVEPPRMAPDTQSAKFLKSLPPAQIKTVVSVYDFQDQTGQLKPNSQFAEYSKAVTQGGLAILSKALLQAGNGSWFTVVERGGLKDLLQERQIIRTMRDQYAAPDGQKLGNLPPLLYAGMLIEGGVIGYDSNTVTGGLGANYLGVGGDVNYQRDVATVDLRAVNIATGEVLLSVTAEKTIYSTAIQGNIFKYISFDHLLQAETGFTTNEPPQLAVRKAIETAVYSLVMEGVHKGYYQFADQKTGQAVLSRYLKENDENDENDKSALPAADTNLAQPSNIRVSNPPATAMPQKGLADPAAKSEKKSIFDNIGDFLSFGNDDNSQQQNPVGYPVLPVQQKSSH